MSPRRAPSSSLRVASARRLAGEGDEPGEPRGDSEPARLSTEAGAVQSDRGAIGGWSTSTLTELEELTDLIR